MSSDCPPSERKSHFRSLRSRLRQHIGLLVALAIYLLLALVYFFVVPIFEGPDEWTHTGHIKYIAEGNGLPVMLPGQGIWGGQQPPLYYVVGAVLAQPFEFDGVADYEESRRNPHASIGFALDPGNKNNYLHLSTERFPYRGLSLTVHVLRLYSIAYGIVALIFIYFTAHEIYQRSFTAYGPNRTGSRSGQVETARSRWFATTVALFVAVQPMYTFITASVANEPANIALSAITVWLAQRYVLRRPPARIWRAVALGTALGLVSLAKMTGLSVGLVAVIAFLQSALAYRQQPGAARLLWRDGFIISAGFVLIGGWWYWRNYQLYGDFFQQGLYKLYFGVNPQPLALSDFLYHLSIGEVSFWATFGWLNIVAPDWVYVVYRIISRLGLAGVAVAVLAQVWRRGKAVEAESKPSARSQSFHQLWLTLVTHPLLLHFVFPIVLAFSLTRLVATEGGLQGRQLLPAAGSMAIVILWGWWAILPAKIRLAGVGVLLALLLVVAVWLPLGVVSPAYIPRPLLAAEEVPADLIRQDWTYRDEIKLLGASIGTDVIKPGERLPVTVYWQALKSINTDYSIFVHLIGRGYENVGQFNTYPSLGLRPTSNLQPGDIVADTYPVLVSGGSEAPTRLIVNVGIFDFNEPGRPGIPATGPDGKEVPPTVGQVKLIPHEWPVITPTMAVDFADSIRLIDAATKGCNAVASDCSLRLVWKSDGQPTVDYTVFVQLWQDGQQIAGFDAPPLNNDYPTSIWEANEVIVDLHTLDLSELQPGSYRIVTGLYNFSTNERLPATANGELLPDYAVDLGTITLE